MIEKNNQNSFENFFHDKAKEYNIPFNEGDWLHLEKKLDLRDAQIAYRNKVRWITAAALLIISFMGYFTYENHNRLNQISQQLGSDAIQPRAISPFSAAENPETESDAVQDGHYANERPGQSEEADDLLISQLTDQMDGISVQGEDVMPDEENLADLSTDNISVQYLAGSEEITLSKISSALLSDFETYRPRAVKIFSEVAKTDQKPGSFPQLAFAEYERDVRNRFSIGLVAGPDVSSVGAFSSFHEPGYKIGLMLEYNISSNVSVSTGAVQSMVRYSTQGQRYNPPIYWTSGISPDEMAGECLLIDIPINFKYNFLNFNNSRFFASAGFSSYIMLTEEYHFKYDGYDSELNQNWSGRTGTRHWMSNASFSLGYELDLHSNWSVRAEPFIKTPIREVGWSNVKLFSAGSLVSLNYRL